MRTMKSSHTLGCQGKKMEKKEKEKKERERKRKRKKRMGAPELGLSTARNLHPIMSGSSLIVKVNEIFNSLCVFPSLQDLVE